MTKKEQRAFVRELSKNVTRSVLANSKKWPMYWDGHELRALVERAFCDANMGQCQSREHSRIYYAARGDRRRTRDFNNECIVLNLP